MYAPRLSKRLLEKRTNAGRKFIPALPQFQNPNAGNIGNDDDDDDDEQQPFKFPKLFGNNNNDDVYTTRNHIYYVCVLGF
jgi:hypothetical protein